MNSGVSVRAYRTDDYDACRGLWVQLTEHHREVYDAPEIGGDDPGAGFDKHLAEHGPDELIVAESDGTIVGLAGLILQDSDAEVEPVIVDRSQRGSGVGHLLISALRERALAIGAAVFQVKVVARNASALAFYKSAGFKTVGMVELFELLDSDRTWLEDGATISGVSLDV